jgi:hypothetical protein
LLKQALAKVDNLGETGALHYLQTKEKYEVDFTLIGNEKVDKMVEVKLPIAQWALVCATVPKNRVFSLVMGSKS